MENTPPATIMSHVSIGTDDFGESVEFYSKVLATLGAQVIMKEPGAAAFGRQFPEFWVQPPLDGKASTVGNGSHFAFFARNREEVHAFYRAALEAGAAEEGEPGPRPQYGQQYYGCFVRDPNGHKLEATFWDETQDSA
mgnify:CR=1 FL=1